MPQPYRKIESTGILPPDSVIGIRTESPLDRWARVGKHMATTLASVGILLYGFFVATSLLASSANSEVRSWALGLVSSIVGAAAGYLFGRRPD